MPEINFIIPDFLNGMRIDKALSIYYANTSRTNIQKAIKDQRLRLNGKLVSNLSLKVKENDFIEFFFIEKDCFKITSSNIPLDVLYEDNDLIVLNKSSSMVVHPGAGCYQDTLVNALLYYTDKLSDEGEKIRPGIVHRLDKNTSGLMVVAKSNLAYKSLVTQIKLRILKRKYKALVWGIIKPSNGIINKQIARSTLNRKKMTTVKIGGKIAITHYRTLEIFRSGMLSLVECSLETGRTHQIRVHLSHLGHSIVGDQTYGNNKRKIKNCSHILQEELSKFSHQALHSFYISFFHPITNILMEFKKPLPPAYNRLITLLRRNY